MGAATSIQNSVGIEEFRLMREEYENKLKEDGVTDDAIYEHMQTLINRVAAADKADGVVLSTNMLNIAHENNNCNDEVRRKVALNLLSKPGHALYIMKGKVETAIKEMLPATAECNCPGPVVTVQMNFDSLLIPKDHYCRRPSDVYYATDNAMLRTHLTAHMADQVREDKDNFMLSGPVFRRIEEDSKQSELSHQLQLVHIAEAGAEEAVEGPAPYVAISEAVVKKVLSEPKLRWEELEEFPFVKDTVMSLEILFEGQPLEVAHGGQLCAAMMEQLGQPSKRGYFVSFDLDHLAMVCGGNPTDIRSLQQDLE